MQTGKELVCERNPYYIDQCSSVFHDVNFYNVYFYNTDKLATWANDGLAKEYIDTLENDGCAWNMDCVEDGCRWATIYYFSGVVMLVFAATSLVQVAGSWYHKLRFLGVILACILGCINLAALILTGVVRFNTMGKLAALSQLDNQYDGVSDSEDMVLFISGGRTYQSDGALIVGLWIAQMALCLASSCYTAYANKPREGSEEQDSQIKLKQAKMVPPEHQLLVHD